MTRYLFIKNDDVKLVTTKVHSKHWNKLLKLGWAPFYYVRGYDVTISKIGDTVRQQISKVKEPADE